MCEGEDPGPCPTSLAHRGHTEEEPLAEEAEQGHHSREEGNQQRVHQGVGSGQWCPTHRRGGARSSGSQRKWG